MRTDIRDASGERSVDRKLLTWLPFRGLESVGEGDRRGGGRVSMGKHFNYIFIGNMMAAMIVFYRTDSTELNLSREVVSKETLNSYITDFPCSLLLAYQTSRLHTRSPPACIPQLNRLSGKLSLPVSFILFYQEYPVISWRQTQTRTRIAETWSIAFRWNWRSVQSTSSTSSSTPDSTSTKISPACWSTRPTSSS